MCRFIPIQTSVPGSSYAGTGGTVPIAKRAANETDYDLDLDLTKSGVSNFATNKKAYPQQVKCYNYKQGKCVTVTETSTSTVAPTKTVTNIETFTTTEYPGVSRVCS